MDIYTAVFGATIESVRCAKSRYVARYGNDSFERLIMPYVSMQHPGHIFSAPESLNLYFYLDALGRCVAFKRKEEYEQPYSFMAVNIQDVEPDVCPVCGTLVHPGALITVNRNQMCLLCYCEASEKMLENLALRNSSLDK